MMIDFVFETVENLRYWARLLSALDSPFSTPAERADACREIFSGDQNFWLSVAEITSPPRLIVVTEKSKSAVNLTPINELVPVANAPTPAMPVEEPARKVKMNAPPKKGRPINNTMAEKLAAALEESQTKKKAPTSSAIPPEKYARSESSSFTHFRKLMTDGGLGKEYRVNCRKAVEAVLPTLSERSDWELLVKGMIDHLFFWGQKEIDLFLKKCPQDLLVQLAQQGFPKLLDNIRSNGMENMASPPRVAFMAQVCGAVGEPASEVFLDAQNLVALMKKRGDIERNGLLVNLVGRIKNQVFSGKEAVADLKADQKQEIAEAVVEEAPDLAGQAPDVVESEGDKSVPTTDEVVDNGLDKPSSLGTFDDADFERQMLEGAGELDLGEMTEKQLKKLDRLTAPDEPTPVTQLIDCELVTIQ